MISNLRYTTINVNIINFNLYTFFRLKPNERPKRMMREKESDISSPKLLLHLLPLLPPLKLHPMVALAGNATK